MSTGPLAWPTPKLVTVWLLSLIHGWACDRGFWRKQIEALSGVCRVVAPDLRGHGVSSVPEDDYSLGRLAGDIYSLCHDLGATPFVLVGHSIGGMVAQRYALDHPDGPSGPCVGGYGRCRP